MDCPPEHPLTVDAAKDRLRRASSIPNSVLLAPGRPLLLPLGALLLGVVVGMVPGLRRIVGRRLLAHLWGGVR